MLNVFEFYMYGILLGLWGPQGRASHSSLNRLQHRLVWAIQTNLCWFEWSFSLAI